MIDDETTQTVGSDATGAAPQPAPSAQNAPARAETLEDILKEFSDPAEDAPQPNPAPAPTPQAAPVSAPAPVNATEWAAIREQLDSIHKRDARKDLETVLGRIKGEANVDGDVLEAYVEGKARRDPRLAQAYAQRSRNPGAWAKVEDQLRSEIVRKFGKNVDQPVTDTREAIAAAVRGSSTAAKSGELSDRDIMSMDQSEWAKLQAKHGVRPV